MWNAWATSSRQWSGTKRSKRCGELGPAPRYPLWWLDGTGDLAAKERTALDRLAEDGHRPFLCAISLWEMALLVELDRVALREPFDAWIETAAGAVSLLDVTPAIARALLSFPRSFHRDPADRLIVATARALELPVLTYDRAIRQSGLVRRWRP